MPFEGEFATGEALRSLEQSPAFRDFKGRIRLSEAQAPLPPKLLQLERNMFRPRRVIAIDGSQLTVPVRNGFPMAELSLMKVAVIGIDLEQLFGLPADEIPSPRVFYDMEDAFPFDHLLPGANVDRPGVEGDTPRRYFRECAFDAFGGRLDSGHETLLETVRAIVGGPHTPEQKPACPVEDCEHRLEPGTGAYTCPCERAAALYETDAFRFAERFSEVSSNMEAHSEVRQALEVVSLLNVLRFFARSPEGFRYLRENVFLLDGPLALFGHPAWLTPYVRRELERIAELCRAQGFELAVFGFMKHGAFAEHFENLDFSREGGPRSHWERGTLLSLDADYINRNITLRPPGSKPHGADTYFGRILLYKTRAGEHAVLTPAMTNASARDLRRADLGCYPRLGDMLNVLDDLATYLYRDGFAPLVRAHAHAAIPLRQGTDMILSLFGSAR